jgi:ribosomal protein S4E
MDWISLAKDKEHWRVLLNTVTKVQVSQNTGNCLTE